MAAVPSVAAAIKKLRPILERVPLFAGFSDDDVLRIGAASRMRTYARDEVVIDCGEPPRAIYAITSGSLKVVRPRSSAPDATLVILGTGEVFGEVAILSEASKGRIARVTAIRESTIMVIEAKAFISLLEASPVMPLRLLSVLAGRLRATTDHFDDVTSLDVPGRLARQLLVLAQRFGSPVGDGVGLRVPLSQRDLGELVDTSRQDVATCIRSWTAEGTLRLRDGQLVIVDIDALRVHAGDP